LRAVSGDYLTRGDHAVILIDRLLRILDRDSLRNAITEVIVDSRGRTKAATPT
jgi:hypothetical protein